LNTSGVTTKVPAEKGGRIRFKGKYMGTITGERGCYLRITLDGDKNSGIYHPTWEIEYLPITESATKGSA
jgi:hypothetical protein